MISDLLTQQQNKWWQTMQAQNPVGNVSSPTQTQSYFPNTTTSQSYLPTSQSAYPEISAPTYTDYQQPNYTIEVAQPTDTNLVNPTRDLTYLQAGSLVQYMPMSPSLGRWLQWQ